MLQLTEQKELVSFFLKKGILINSDILEKITDKTTAEDIYGLLKDKVKENEVAVVFDELLQILKKQHAQDISWQDLEKSKVLSEKGHGQVVKKFVDYIEKETKKEPITINNISIISSYEESSKPREIQDFVMYFNARYQSIKKILENRRELQNMLSINRIIFKKDRENISLIGMVRDIGLTKNQNLVLTVEDPTGFIKVMVNKNKPELYEQCKSIVLDEVIGVVGVNGENVVFANNVLWPDIPVTKELKKSPVEEYAIFLSDLHVGSTKFLKDDFMKFIKWLKGDIGSNEQREIAKKVKYIFIIGDLVDGVGIYPGQDDDLEIKDIYMQYKECAELLKGIPQHITLIICPGNHDAMRVAEPQPKLYQDFAEHIYALPNAILVSNPAYINFAANPQFPGFDVLMYHGYSFDYFVAHVDSIRNKGGYDKPDLLMKFLLRRRHLAPSHGSNLYIPDTKKDYMVIDRIPDFFVTGHIHKSSVSQYRNITLICGSCWQSKTDYMEKMGHIPEPGRIPIVNLQTREVKILKFSKE